MDEFKFDPKAKYGNVIEGKPDELESKLIPIILEDARKILPKGTRFSMNSFKDEYAAAAAWRYPVSEPGSNKVKTEVIVA